MKIKREEFMRWYEGGISVTKGHGFNWFDMNTDGAKNMSDSELLGRISHLPAVVIPGDALIAELCKRFNADT